MNPTQVDAQTAYYFCREDFENTNKISKNTTIIYHPSHNRSLQYYGYTILYHDFNLNRLDISMGGWNYGVPHRRINSVLEFMFTRGYLPRLWQLEKKGEERGRNIFYRRLRALA